MCARARRPPLHRARACERWNQPKGPHRAKTKHGNYNAWLDAHGDDYDFFARRRPRPRAAAQLRRAHARLLPRPGRGVRRRPAGLRQLRAASWSRAAESQQFLFHSLLQRAGNRSRTPMLVGTNNAVRVSALRQIGGFQDSITEDMATGLELHRSAQPGDRAALDARSTRPDVRRGRRGPRVLHRLLQPAGPLVARDRRGAGRAVLAAGAPARARRAGHYLLLTCLLPDGRDHLDPGARSTRSSTSRSGPAAWSCRRTCG